MANKLNIEFIREQFKEAGCELLETTYKSAKTKMKYICVCGNKSEICWDKFRIGQRCVFCAGHEKLDIEFIKSKFDKRGYILLNKIKYINNKTKLDYICKKCNLKSSITWANFQYGYGCKQCGYEKIGDIKRHSFEYISNFFEQCGCELLDIEYNGNKAPLNFKCHCGNISSICFDNFRVRKQCSLCGLHSRSGPNSKNWNPDREYIKLKKLIHNKCCQLLHRCLDSIKDITKTSSTYKMLGYDTTQLLDNITSYPNWNTLKETNWHLDHIFPVSAFIKYGITDIKIINSLDNLQPLSAIDNITKSDKYNKQEFIEYLKTKNIFIQE